MILDLVRPDVRWQGRGLPEGARVRVVWVAEDVGDLVEPNFIVDETESVAPAPDARARFTLARPPDGWAEGKYRVEFYVNEELEEMVEKMPEAKRRDVLGDNVRRVYKLSA